MRSARRRAGRRSAGRGRPGRPPRAARTRTAAATGTAPRRCATQRADGAEAVGSGRHAGNDGRYSAPEPATRRRAALSSSTERPRELVDERVVAAGTREPLAVDEVAALGADDHVDGGLGARRRRRGTRCRRHRRPRAPHRRRPAACRPRATPPPRRAAIGLVGSRARQHVGHLERHQAGLDRGAAGLPEHPAALGGDDLRRAPRGRRRPPARRARRPVERRRRRPTGLGRRRRGLLVVGSRQGQRGHDGHDHGQRSGRPVASAPRAGYESPSASLKLIVTPSSLATSVARQHLERRHGGLGVGQRVGVGRRRRPPSRGARPSPRPPRRAASSRRPRCRRSAAATRASRRPSSTSSPSRAATPASVALELGEVEGGRPVGAVGGEVVGRRRPRRARAGPGRRSRCTRKISSFTMASTLDCGSPSMPATKVSR